MSRKSLIRIKPCNTNPSHAWAEQGSYIRRLSSKLEKTGENSNMEVERRAFLKRGGGEKISHVIEIANMVETEKNGGN